MNFHFAGPLNTPPRYICDRICGHQLSDNFRYTVRQIIYWLGGLLNDHAACKIVFHLGQPSGYGIDHILSELAKFKQWSLPNTEMSVNIYRESAFTQSLPHQRFIMTDQIALNIDRGLDFLDRKTHRCRDTFICCQDRGEAQRLLDCYATTGLLTCHPVG